MIVKSGLFLWSRFALTSYWLRFFVWLSLLTLVIGGLWWVTERKIHLAEQEARGLAMRQSVSLANSYAGAITARGRSNESYDAQRRECLARLR